MGEEDDSAVQAENEALYYELSHALDEEKKPSKAKSAGGRAPRTPSKKYVVWVISCFTRWTLFCRDNPADDTARNDRYADLFAIFLLARCDHETVLQYTTTLGNCMVSYAHVHCAKITFVISVSKLHTNMLHCHSHVSHCHTPILYYEATILRCESTVLCYELLADGMYWHSHVSHCHTLIL